MHPPQLPSMVFADAKGNITDFEPLSMAGMSNSRFSPPQLEDLIELPVGSELFVLPGRLPVGYDNESGEPLLLEENPYDAQAGLQAVAAFMAPAHTAILSAAYQKKDSTAPRLPLFAYSAVGWFDGKFWVTGFRSDKDIRQDSQQFNQQTIEKKTKKTLKTSPNNRLIQHLGKCCLTYCCPAARNYFLGRWEAPIPTSPKCNAKCLGCISLQSSGCCPSTQDRITFVPTPGEIRELAVQHIKTAPRPIVSFGQGCEGEPLLQAGVIEKAIRLIRKETLDGTINLNSNASLPDKVKILAKAGLDSIRVSLNSAQKHYYTPYYRPQNYRFEDVLESIRVMKGEGKFISLNYFVLPGFTDSNQEFDQLCQVLERYSVDFVQMRNLNIDPEYYLEAINFPQNENALGIRKWKDELSSAFPHIRFGYFNPEVR